MAQITSTLIPLATAIFLMVVLLLAAIAILWSMVRMHKIYEPEDIAEDTEPLFSAATNQSFDMAISHFRQFSERARITFLHKFITNLSPAEAKKAIKYINQIHNIKSISHEQLSDN